LEKENSLSWVPNKGGHQKTLKKRGGKSQGSEAKEGPAEEDEGRDLTSKMGNMETGKKKTEKRRVPSRRKRVNSIYGASGEGEKVRWALITNWMESGPQNAMWKTD